MLVPWKTPNGRHITTSKCDKGEERKRRRLAEEDIKESVERAFQAYSRPMIGLL